MTDQPPQQPLYFGREDRPLAGFLHRVSTTGQRPALGIVMVSPFGWEEVASHRVRRRLAISLAGEGIPVLRYDLPGTGDSAGGPSDPALVADWIASVSTAAAELRRQTGVVRVCSFGIRLGAMLSLAAVPAGALDAIIAWAPSARGRAVVRELKAFRNLETSGAESASVSAPHVDGMEAGGFRLSAATIDELQDLDLSAIPDSAYAQLPILHLSRDDLPADERLVKKLAVAGASVRTITGHGFAAMMGEPHETEVPTASMVEIADWLGELSGEAVESVLTSTEARSTAVVEVGVVERSVVADTPFGRSFAIACAPAEGASDDLGVLFLNAGAVRHIGPNRLWVELARRLARRGVPSLRVDLEGIGESDGASERFAEIESFYRESLIEQALEAVDCLARDGVRRVAIVGLCSGAFQAFHAAARSPRVASAVMLNPRLLFWDPEIDRQRAARAAYGSIASGSSWRKLLAGGVSPARALRLSAIVARRSVAKLQGAARRTGGAAHDPLHHALGAIERSGGRALLVFSELEPLSEELELRGQLPGPDGPPSWRLWRAGDAGHTFRPLQSQRELIERVEHELAALETANGTAEEPGPPVG